MFSGDFVKLTNAPSGVSHGSGHEDDWTDQEILLLLEGIEMYDDDWSLIEEHVGTRSAQQCIRKFLELPIEDPYLDTEGSMGLLRHGRIPFEQADNPVMSVVAFLAGVVAPGVAAEAAKTALHALADGDQKENAAQDESEAKPQQGQEDKKDAPKSDDRMEEDITSGSTVQQNAEASSSKAGTPAPAPDGMPVDSPGSKKPTPTVPHSRVARAADLALKASAKAANALADAEDSQIRSTLASLIKLTLTKLELKMSQFEELEEILEDERKGLESARMALVGERLNLKRMLDNVRSELTKNGGGGLSAAVAQANLGTTGQGTILNEIQAGMQMDGDTGPVSDGSMLQLS